MKYCGRCGSGNADTARFCVECGAPLDTQQGTGQQSQDSGGYDRSGGFQNGGYQNGGFQNGGFQNGSFQNGGFQIGGFQNGGFQNRSFQDGGNGREEIIYTNVAPRSIPVAIILSIVTCGIYLLYWMYMINNEINDLAQDPMAPSGGIVILLSIVTCGIYTWYWYYKMGEKCDYITQSHSSSNVIFLLLGIFGLGIVSIALMQDAVNRVLQ